jgi:hypothetical protein
MDDQKHEQRPADHDGDGNLQAKLHVVKIRDLANHVGPEPAHQLSGKHVDADGSGVRAARHHVVKNGSDGAVIPGHEKAGNEKADEHDCFLFRLNGQQEKGRREQECDRNGEDAPVANALMQAIRNESAGQDSKERR